MEMKKQIKVLKQINKFFKELENEEDKNTNNIYLTYDSVCLFKPLTQELKDLFIKFRSNVYVQEDLNIKYDGTNKSKYNCEYMKKIYDFFVVLGENPIIQIGEDKPITFKSKSLIVILAPIMIEE